jgi:hypothetical protein
MATFLLDAAAIRVAIANARRAEFGTHHALGIQAVDRKRHRDFGTDCTSCSARRLCRPHCGDGDAGDLASHRLACLFSWG